MDSHTGPFSIAARAWQDMLKRAEELKSKRFTLEAIEGLRFLTGPYDFFHEGIRNDKFFRPGYDAKSNIIVTLNKTAELRDIFAPAMYHQNPTRRATVRPAEEFSQQVNPELFQSNPQALQGIQQAYQMGMIEHQYDKCVGALFEAMGNVSPDKLDLKTQSRLAVDQALITGLGILRSDYKTAPVGGTKMCGSFWVSSMDYLMDPDANCIGNRKWEAVGTWMPAWEAERRWRLPTGTLPRNKYSNSGLSSEFVSSSNPTGVRPDMVRVMEVWSKIGCGGRLPQAQWCPPESRIVYELMGDYCYLVIVEGHPWPLNVPPWMFIDNPNCWADAKRAMEWPTPHWMQEHGAGWTNTPLYFHTVPDDPWPLSHLTPGMGYLKFLNWAFAKMATKIAVTSRDLLLMDDTIVKAFEETLKRGADLTAVKIQGMSGQDISKMVYQFQHQPWNQDFFKVIEYMTEGFERATGLNELMYGQSATQMRSAQEADRKYDQISVRPDDMATKVDEAMSTAASREMLCSRWHLQGADVDAQLGPLAAAVWDTLVMPAPIERIFNIQMRIEDDSTQRPSKGALISNLNDALQLFIQPFFSLAQLGLPGPFNALVSSWAEAVGIPDKERLAINPPEAAVPPPEPEKKAA